MPTSPPPPKKKALDSFFKRLTVQACVVKVWCYAVKSGKKKYWSTLYVLEKGINTFINSVCTSHTLFLPFVKEREGSVSAYLLTSCMEQTPSWEANQFSASQIPHILWNL